MSDEILEEYDPDENELIDSDNGSQPDEYSELDSDEENLENVENEVEFLDTINKYQDGIENYKNSLDKMLKNREINRDDYYNELIQIEEFEIELNKQQNQIALTDAGLELINKLNIKREELRNNLSLVSLEDYNKKMLDFIKEEKQIINDYQVIITRGPKVDKLKTLPFLEKINELIKREEKIIKTTANSAGIKLEKPKNTDPLYESKLLEYNKNIRYIKDYYLPGYKLALINPTNLNPPDWELNYDPTLNSLKSLRKIEEPPKLIKDFEKSKYGAPDLVKKPLIKDTTFIKNQFIKKIPVVNSINIEDITNFITLIDNVSIKGKNLREIKIIEDRQDIKNFIDSLYERGLENFGRYKEPIYGKNISDIVRISINNKIVSIEFNDAIKYSIDISNIDFFPLIKVDSGLTQSIPKENVTFLYILTKGTTRKVFINFKDYIKELNEILLNNLKEVTDLSSKNSLQFKIDQINYYLENNEFMNPEVLLTVSDKKIREIGLEKLINIFSSHQEYSEDKVIELEAQIAVTVVNYDLFNKDSYNFIVNKIHFISIQYQELVLDYLLARITSTFLINFEVPKNFPDDFTYKENFKNLSPEEKLSKLLKWEPNTENYSKYKKYVQDGDTIEAIDEKLTNDNIFLDYKIVREIYLEFREKQSWDTYRRNINLINIPEFKNEYLWKFKILNQKRNTLPSMRIYQVANISERILATTNLENLLIKCKIQNSDYIASIVEKIIFEKSNTDIKYKENINSAIKNYGEFCSLIEDGYNTDSIVSNIVTLTDYFMNGNNITKSKIKQIVKAIEEQNNLELENILTVPETELINSIFLELRDRKNKKEQTEKDKDKFIMISSFFSRLNNISKKQHKLNEYIIEINKYIKPTVSKDRPEYGIRFIYSNSNYIYGGYYPSLKDPSGNYNYTRDNLIELVKIFGFNIEVDNQIDDIYTDIMNKLNKLPEDRNINIIEHKSYLIDTTKDYKNLNIQTKTMFTFRKLNNYPEPGVPFRVYKGHFDLSFCVPIYYKNGIPVYSIKQKELAENKIAIIEGPAIFEKSNIQSAVSEYYCIVEHLDHRGTKIYFKEGVYKDKIKYSYAKEVSTCSSYKTKEDCLNPFSMSLDGSKCMWVDNRCVKLEPVREPTRDIWFWNPDDINIKDKWFMALENIRDTVIDIINGGRIMYLPKINKLIDEYSKKLEDIKFALEEQSKQITIKDPSSKPDNHYMQVMTKKQIENEKDIDKNLRNNIIFEDPYIKDILNRKKEVTRKIIPDGYIPIEIPVFSIRYIESKQIKTQSGKLKNKNILTNKTTKDKEIVKTIIVAYISHTDKVFLDSPPKSFFWFVKTPDYLYEDQSVIIKNNTNKVNYIPIQKIIPTGKVPIVDLPLITRDDIKRATVSVAFSTLIDIDGMLDDDIIFDAEPEAISFCLDNNINPIEITNGTKKLTLDITIQYFESKKIKTVSLDEKIRSSLEKAITNKNTDLLKSIISQIKFLKDKLDPSILIHAETSLKEITMEKEKIDKLSQKIQEKVKQKKIDAEINANLKEKDTIKKFNKSINTTSSKLSRKAKML